MGLFDRLLNSSSDQNEPQTGPKAEKPKPEAFFLDSDNSSSLGKSRTFQPKFLKKLTPLTFLLHFYA